MGKLTIFLICTFICTTVAATAAGMQETYRATIGDDGIQRVELVGGSYFFRPGHVIVKVDVPVELTVRKDGWIVPHDIVIDAPDAGITVRESLSAEPKVIRFTPTKAGRYPFYCSKKPPFMASHREKGMEGVLEVVE